MIIIIKILKAYSPDQYADIKAIVMFGKPACFHKINVMSIRKKENDSAFIWILALLDENDIQNWI